MTRMKVSIGISTPAEETRMETSAETVGKWTELTVTGRIDTHTAPALEEACRVQLAKGATWLALDL